MRHLLTVLLILTFVISGCSTNEGSQGESANEYETKPINVKNSVEDPVDKETGQQISKHLVDIATRIPGVNDATAVVLGKYAVVGIDIDSKLDRNKAESIKYSVAESLKHDPHGANSVIIADADTNERLREMAREIEDGRPVLGILDELAAIVGRVIPEIPADILDNQQKEPTEQEQDQLNPQEEKELNKEQQDQSNNQMDKKD
ncbi:YhcN/YlaJ family sporulation lipoprotein [Metabacillus herbersteinensis]|uniref:YhcN/YlaJ family sporulation lipoprotein n=1 Tax=Metabacillus herbersteinensis TaxID=283816 RepID=A0ABV6GLW1_9BACI